LYLAITAPRSPLHLTALDCCSEDVRVPPIVVAELELRDVERHVFGADFVEGADNAALEDRPEAFNRVRVDRTDNVLAFGMINDAMRELFTERPITSPCVSAEQTDFLRNRAAHESGEGRGIDVLDNARHDLSSPLTKSRLIDSV